MSNDKNETNVYERLWKLWAMICKMVMDGVRDPQKVADVLQTIIDEKVEEAKVYLKELWYGLDLDAVESPQTFQSSGLFTGGVYGLAVPEVAKGKTQAAKANISEMIVDGNFVQIFGSLGKNRKRWTESQVVQFCRKYRGKLRTGGYATFFEMEGGCVAGVVFDVDGRLEVDVHSFSLGRRWDAEYRRRLVSLQQAL